MPASSRRILAYWLLLLLPALAVGAGALYLLRKEQARLDEQARSTTALRREAVAARARQIAENVELIIGDVQAGLMATLNQAMMASPEAFLKDWGAGNPLVRATFRLSPGDQIVYVSDAGARGWLTPWLAEGTPWRLASPNQKEAESAMDQLLRKDASDNVSNVQNARNRLQEVARQSPSSDALKKLQAPTAVSLERTGWAPWRGPDGLHLVGWRQSAMGGVIGVEVNLTPIFARFGELLPRDGDLANAFEVREAGVTRQSWGFFSGGLRSRSSIPNPLSKVSRYPADDGTVRVPLSSAALPGWEIVGVVGDGATEGAGGRFFLFGSLLVGIFIAAILAGGSLLVRQARRSEAEAAQKTSFVANVSHEFKTPLTTIRLYAELLEQGRVRDAAQGRDYLRTIARETQRLARLVNNALDFSRLEQGKKKFSVEPLDLGAELTRLLDTHGPRLAESGLALRRQLPAVPVTMETDRDALEQIVLNLLDNACKY
ncbi:MAG: HAMP domain-containing sensor histidine kinase, partial [Verrucomicrobia bacterium]|nr:HAMP domain-containing sensor histidine kinase [Verrucomicrobiota bacterium]